MLTNITAEHRTDFFINDAIHVFAITQRQQNDFIKQQGLQCLLKWGNYLRSKTILS